MKLVTAALIGAGDRGENAFGPYAINNPGTIQFVAVVERDEARRNYFRTIHGIPDSMAFSNWDNFFAKGKVADALLICTNENDHSKTITLSPPSARWNWATISCWSTQVIIIIVLYFREMYVL